MLKLPLTLQATVVLSLLALAVSAGCRKKVTYPKTVKPAENDSSSIVQEGDDQTTAEDTTDNSDADTSDGVSFETAPQKIADLIVLTPEKKELGTYAAEAESGVLAGQMKAAPVDTASGGSYVSTPNVDPATDLIEDPAASADRLRYKFTVAEAGNYRVFAKISAPTEEDDQIYVSLDQGTTFVPMVAPLTNDNEFVWVEANEGGDRLDNPVALIAGDFTLEFRRFEAGVKIDAIAITTNPAFTGTDMITTPAVKVLRFDVSKLCGTAKAVLEVEVSEKVESYTFRKPRVIADKPLTVKAINFKMNGVANPAYGLFADIDTQVPADSAAPVSEAELVVPVAKGSLTDQFSFSFGQCSPQ